jgi:hypothetical protein
MAVDFGLAGFPRIPFDPQTSNNDVQLWLTPAVLGVSAPWLFFKAYQEQRISWPNVYYSRESDFHVQESRVFPELWVWCQYGLAGAKMHTTVLRFSLLTCLGFRVNLDDTQIC